MSIVNEELEIKNPCKLASRVVLADC